MHNTKDIPAAKMVGLIGPERGSKSSLLSLLAGSRAVQEGTVEPWVATGLVPCIAESRLPAHRLHTRPQAGQKIYILCALG